LGLAVTVVRVVAVLGIIFPQVFQQIQVVQAQQIKVLTAVQVRVTQAFMVLAVVVVVLVQLAQTAVPIPLSVRQVA
jgi:hypothetical protein